MGSGARAYAQGVGMNQAENDAILAGLRAERADFGDILASQNLHIADLSDKINAQPADVTVHRAAQVLQQPAAGSSKWLIIAGLALAGVFFWKSKLWT